MTGRPGRRALRSRLLWPLAIHGIRVGARLFWRLRVDEGAGFPPPPFVLAANHYSFLDPPLVGAVYGKPARFLALVDLYGNHRWLDWALDALEVITMRRETVPLGPVRQALDHLAAGGVVGLFPEGIRTHCFGEAGFKRGAAWLAMRAGVPLVPVAVRGTDRILGVDNKLHRGRAEVVIGPSLQPTTTAEDLMREWVEWVGKTLI